MGTVLILGAGTAGTMLANHLVKTLPNGWDVSVVDQDDAHHYQPGYLFVPVGMMPTERVSRPRRAQLADGVTYTEAAVRRIDPATRSVTVKGGEELGYDYLVIATGSHPDPALTAGLTDERIWRRSAHEFYTLEGATALKGAIDAFEGGKILVHVAEMPIKCPVAPLEMAFLVEDHFRKRRIRHRVDITYVTPLDGAFTKPVASKALGGLLDDRSIRLAADFAVERVDPATQQLIAYDGRELDFDLLITVPVHTGAKPVADSGLADAMGFVTVDKHTLRSTIDSNVFAIGDATDVPTSKAGAVAHFQVEHLVANLLAVIDGREPTSHFDGHANCFVESGRGKALLLDFNYDTEPLAGKFPVPGIGPMTLLGESRTNHLGKLAFEHLYWQMLLPGRPLPVPNEMSMAGKRPAEEKGA